MKIKNILSCSIIISCFLCVPLYSKKEVAKKDDGSMQPRYMPKNFTIVMLEDKKFSQEQLDDHKTLYRGYVARRNEIDEGLAAVSHANQNITYSPFRSLKISETFARNGALLHELYFENIKADTVMGKHTRAMILKNFDSLDHFKDDLLTCARCARGWAITCYNLDDHRMQNYVLDAHNETVPILTVPLLVLDTYEHAYMIDFGINRALYLDILWNNINWDVVEERITAWIHE
jgi:superoxide dismutase, Fe-Mn family